MPRTYGFGVIGAGFIGEFHAQAIQLLPNARLVAGCARSDKSVAKFAEKFPDARMYRDYRDMLKDPAIDVVTIATPSGAHMEPAIDAAQAGKHVIIEKPIEITLNRIDRILDAHHKAGTSVGGIFNGRFTEAAQLFKSTVDQGRFGRLTFGMAYGPWWRDQSYYDDGGWKGTTQYDGGGALMNQGIHTIDMLQWLMGPVKSVQAFAATLAHKRIEVEDTGSAAVEFASGALGTIACTTSMWPGHFRIVEVAGDEGSVAMADSNFFFWKFKKETDADEKIRREKVAFPAASTGASSPGAGLKADAHSRNIAEFLDALDHKRRPLIDGNEARKGVEIILAIYQSARSRKAVDLPLH
jgi:UDP-N-acetyl-2-amino-2-deoxyglucuronate dehydrogenase